MVGEKRKIYDLNVVFFKGDIFLSKFLFQLEFLEFVLIQVKNYISWRERDLD